MIYSINRNCSFPAILVTELNGHYLVFQELKNAHCSQGDIMYPT